MIHQKCFVPANMFSKLTLACMENGGALKSKYEQNLNKKRNLFFFNFNSAPRWKCIWGAADENQSKSVGRRDPYQIIVADAADAVSVNFSGMCKFLQI